MDTSYLAQQVTTIIGQLHGLFDDIGVPGHERDTREAELFSALSETLHNQLKLTTSEKHDLTEECQHLIKTIKQMESSLDGSVKRDSYDPDGADLKVTYPLSGCLQDLKEKYRTVAKLHQERAEQVKKLVEALESYASHLEPSFVKIKLPPSSPNSKISPSFDLSPAYVTSLDNEFSRVYEEYTRRIDFVQQISEEIIMFWAELGIPQAQTDAAIIKYSRDAPEQLGLHQEDLARLKARKEKLVEEKRGRERRIKELGASIEALWDKLGVEEVDRKTFITSNRGCGLRTINEYEDELSRLNELKRQNLHLFVEDARYKLQELWDSLYFSEEEMLDFTPAFSDVYSDALLSAHEAEIARLEALREQRAPMLAMIDKHRSLIKDREELNASSQDASRLMARGQKGEKRDPGKLLREEKMRKRINKELPKVEQELRAVLEQWEDEYGRPFLVLGNRYLDELESNAAKAQPPRSKTPSLPPSTVKHAKSASAVSASSLSRAGSVRGVPPRSKTPGADVSFAGSTRSKTPGADISFAGSTRSKTPGADVNLAGSVRSKTPGADFHSSIRGKPNFSQSARGPNPFAQAASTTKSPTKIPSRAPLSNMPHGNNSPERHGHDTQGGGGVVGGGTMRSTMGPPRVPPPKMRELISPPPSLSRSNSYDTENSNNSIVVRHVPPEDVYDDRHSHPSYYHHHHHHHHHSNPAPAARPSYTRAPPVAGSRQISNTSSQATTVQSAGGSENWETYDDGEDGDMASEPDATEAYYAKVRMQAKRVTPESGYACPRSGFLKKVRGGGGGGGGGVDGGRSTVKIAGSESGWTDEYEEAF